MELRNELTKHIQSNVQTNVNESSTLPSPSPMTSTTPLPYRANAAQQQYPIELAQNNTNISENSDGINPTTTTQAGYSEGGHETASFQNQQK